jgi:dolichyl-phosphate-mannose-protein mannosyltransferase
MTSAGASAPAAAGHDANGRAAVSDAETRAGKSASDRIVKFFDSRTGLACLFAGGLLIRLVLARRSGGLAFDVSLFRSWSERMVHGGPSHMYSSGHFDPAAPNFVDYTPGYLYVLLFLGKVSHAVTGGPPSVFAVKLPGIAADLGVALLVMALAVRVTPPNPERRFPVRAAAAAAVLLNPALILVSAVWGQVDSVLALLVLGGIYVLVSGEPGLPRDAAAVALFAIAAATKPQAVLVFPVLAVVLVRRHVRNTRGPRERRRAVIELTMLALLGLGIVALMFVPFGIAPGAIPRFYSRAGAVYPFTSLWAFNFWGIAGFYRGDTGSGATTIAGISAFAVGLILFTLAACATVVRSWRSLARRVPEVAVATFGAVAMTCLGFALLTRTHERYLYLAVVALAVFVGRPAFWWAFAGLSLCYLLNVHFAYVLFSDHHALTVRSAFDAIFGTTTDAWQRRVLSGITTAACLAVAALGWRWLERDHNSRG